MNRREVLGGASAAWLAMGLDGVRGLAEQAKADELRVGMIGPGSRGQELITATVACTGSSHRGGVRYL